MDLVFVLVNCMVYSKWLTYASYTVYELFCYRFNDYSSDFLSNISPRLVRDPQCSVLRQTATSSRINGGFCTYDRVSACPDGYTAVSCGKCVCVCSLREGRVNVQDFNTTLHAFEGGML